MDGLIVTQTFNDENLTARRDVLAANINAVFDWQRLVEEFARPKEAVGFWCC